MTNDPFYRRFLEISWRRKLTAGEEAELAAWLQSHPEFKADWEAEGFLTEQLGKLPEPSLSSNFTTLVVQQVERASSSTQRKRWRWSPWVLRLLPPMAASAVVLATLHHQNLEDLRHKQMLESVVMVSDVKSLPSVEILKNFDAIRELNTAPAPDEQLISLLQ